MGNSEFYGVQSLIGMRIDLPVPAVTPEELLDECREADRSFVRGQVTRIVDDGDLDFGIQGAEGAAQEVVHSSGIIRWRSVTTGIMRPIAFGTRFSSTP